MLGKLKLQQATKEENEDNQSEGAEQAKPSSWCSWSCRRAWGKRPPPPRNPQTPIRNLAAVSTRNGITLLVPRNSSILLKKKKQLLLSQVRAGRGRTTTQRSGTGGRERSEDILDLLQLLQPKRNRQRSSETSKVRIGDRRRKRTREREREWEDLVEKLKRLCLLKGDGDGDGEMAVRGEERAFGHEEVIIFPANEWEWNTGAPTPSAKGASLEMLVAHAFLFLFSLFFSFFFPLLFLIHFLIKFEGENTYEGYLNSIYFAKQRII